MYSVGRRGPVFISVLCKLMCGVCDVLFITVTRSLRLREEECRERVCTAVVVDEIWDET